jgi:hypothetical protein
VEPRTLDEWLALSSNEQETIHLSQWNVYQGEGAELGTALRDKFVQEHAGEVTAAELYVYHGGVWIITAYVPKALLPQFEEKQMEMYHGFLVNYVDDVHLKATE